MGIATVVVDIKNKSIEISAGEEILNEQVIINSMRSENIIG